jgi:YggT family protein
MPTPFFSATLFIIKTISNLVIFVFLLRLLLQWSKLDFYNPVSQFVFRVTNPLVAPLQRVLPRSRLVDVPGLVILIAVTAAVNFMLLGLWGLTYTPLDFVYYLFARIINLGLLIYIICIIVIAVMSWFGESGHNPIAGALARLVEPVMRPFRRIIPTFEGIDFSPLVAIICLSAIRILFYLPPVLS